MRRTVGTFIGALGLACVIGASVAAQTAISGRGKAFFFFNQDPFYDTVKGAPYSGEAVTESLQVLSDGTRISRRTVTRVFRDTEGRTRREMMAADGSEPESINISDPVAEASYVLNPKTKTAFRNGVVIATPRGGSVGATVAPGTTGVITTTRSPDGQVKVEARQAGLQHRFEVGFEIALESLETLGNRACEASRQVIDDLRIHDCSSNWMSQHRKARSARQVLLPINAPV